MNKSWCQIIHQLKGKLSALCTFKLNLQFIYSSPPWKCHYMHEAKSFPGNFFPFFHINFRKGEPKVTVTWAVGRCIKVIILLGAMDCLNDSWTHLILVRTMSNSCCSWKDYFNRYEEVSLKIINYKTGSELINDFLFHAMMTLIKVSYFTYHVTLQCFINSLASSS